MQQKTLKRSVEIQGLGLHSGMDVNLKLHPAPVNYGIVLKRVDVAGANPVHAHALSITSTELSTTIGEGKSSIATVEHLMAALALAEIDNAHIEVKGPEIPILDGSALPFLKLLDLAGKHIQNAPKSCMVVKDRFEFRSGDQSIIMEPCDKLTVKCTIDFDNAVIGKQSAYFGSDPKDYGELASARTFCHLDDVTEMKRRGLALGGSLDNAIVVSDSGVINEEGLRCSNEFAQHKLLDLLGDFYLLGFPIVGRITAHKPGHTLHADCMSELMLYKNEFLSLEGEPFKGFEARPVATELYAFG